MSTPEVRLDPRNYQDLVDEARTRAGRRCPEWTDHNVSDPGMTLIDQFAWMTDVLLYRVNRIPERLHWKLLELLDIQREPPTAAHAVLRVRLAAPPLATVVIPAGTEVATKPDDEHAAIVFAVSKDAFVPGLRLAAVMLWRSDALTAVSVRDGVARPVGSEREAYSVLPAPDDALYLGFDTSPARLTLQVRVSATEALGGGIDPDLPPVVWETARDDRPWGRVEVLSERTGGFNYPTGITELQVPQDCAQATVGGRRMYWVRCRLVDRPPGLDRYVNAPQLEEIAVDAIGVLTDARHVMVVRSETLGTSDGSAGQTFKVVHAPAHRLQAGEHLEVLEPKDPGSEQEQGTPEEYFREDRNPKPWTRCDSFADSTPEDRHFRFDPATGEVQLGPAIRIPGGWRQHGAVPPKGATLSMSCYRHGGGLLGNVERDRLTVLRTPIPGVARVTNPLPARGGNEVEPQPAARLRAADELRTRHRAVTAEDFETIALRASGRVARVRCVKPAPGSAIVVAILPAAARPEGPLALGELVAPEDLRREVLDALEARCLLGTSLHVTPVALRPITVAVEVLVSPSTVLEDVQARIAAALHAYLNPLVGGDLNAVLDDRADSGEGWQWGRPLHDGELRPLVRSIRGVEAITILRLYETDLASGRPIEPPLEGQLVLAPDELIASGRHAVRAVRRSET
jgi:predicted phage baseplate assembly protein